MNVALIGSNFALRGYLPVIKKINKLNLKIICSRNIRKNQKINAEGVILENNWKNIFKYNIDLIILAVPPKVQEKILLYNLKFKKKIIFEKPISTNYLLSKKIIKEIKNKKINSEVNLTFLNHKLFKKVKKIINQNLSQLISYKVSWSVLSQDMNKKIISWKTDESRGGGIKNIFLIHVFSYIQFLFGHYEKLNVKVKNVNLQNLMYKKFINCELLSNSIYRGNISLLVKKKGIQEHKIEIKFKKFKLKLFTKSKDWTKNFKLKIYDKKNKIIKTYKNEIDLKFEDGRSCQIYSMIRNFLKKSSFTNQNYCLNAEKNINDI
jgi:predicted dehydrogenase